MISWKSCLILRKELKKDENENNNNLGNPFAPLMERFHWTLIAQKDGTILYKGQQS